MNPQATALAPTPPPGPAGVTAASPQTPSVLPTQTTPTYNPQASLDAIKQFYQIPTAAANASVGIKADAFNAQTAFENSQRNLQLQIEHAKDKLDPSKYKTVADSNGGPTKIYDSLGNETDAGTYAKLTGDSAANLLKNSTNPQEQKFVQDYKNYETFMQSLIGSKSGDKQAQITYNDFLKNNPGLSNLTPEQVRQVFMNQYGQYFGAGQGGQATQGVNDFAPTNYLPALENIGRQVIYSGYAGATGGNNAFGVDLSSLSPGQ